MAKSPADRFQTCRDFALAFSAACEQSVRPRVAPGWAGADRAGIDRAGADRAGIDRAGADRAARPVPVTSWDRDVPATSDRVGFAEHEPVRPERMAAAPVASSEFAGRPDRRLSHHFDDGQGTRPHRADHAAWARRRRSNRLRNVTLAVVGLLVLAGVAGAGYKLANRHNAAPPPASGGSQTGVSASRQAELVVHEYFDDINHHFFRAAWKLTPENGESFAQWRAGFAGTKRDAVSISNVKGNVVTATLNAFQTDGTVRVFRGTYTVTNGVISSTNVQRLS